MAFRQWFLRCTPGISTLVLFLIVEYNLQLGRSAYHFLIHSQHEPDYAPSVLCQLLFSAYSIVLHLFGIFFPLRLALAAHRASRSIWKAHLEVKARRMLGESQEKRLNTHPIIQVIVIPCYKESFETIQDTLSVLASHQHANDTYDIYLAMEERDPNGRAVSSRLKSEYASRFMSIQDTFHPAGIAGESAGKSSNVSWAAKEIVRKYADHADRKDVLVTVMDSDAHLLNQHFYLVRERHCANRQTDSCVLYVPPIIFDRNAHLVPRLVRVADLMWCGAGLSCFQAKSSPSDVIIPTAVYTLSLPLVQLADGWDTGPAAIGEDMHMMLKCYFVTKGLVKIESIASPASLCNVSASRSGIGGWIENHHARYSQGLRHMWGSLDSGYAIGLWLDMRKHSAHSSSSSPSRSPRPRKLSETGYHKIDPYELRQPRRFTVRTMTVFARLFEAHFLVLHLLLIIIASAIYHSLPWSANNFYLDWTMHVTEGLRGLGFAFMTVYFVLIYDQFHRTCVTVREWEMNQAGLYDERTFSYRSRWSVSSMLDYVIFPVAGMVFGSIPLLQAAISHFWTENLVYLVSAKPVRILAHRVTAVANTFDAQSKEQEGKHTSIV